ncbi:MAG: Stp1/IreP family PP2C-type Ser/Thr phosphatase [Bacteroidota bacterium]
MESLRVGSLTDVGKVREINQDCFSTDLDSGLFLVADGMGGHLAGEKASRRAVETICEQMAEAEEHSLETLQRAIQEANRQIVSQSLQDPSMRGMGTTVTAVIAKEADLFFGHIGDSRAYLIRRNQIEQVTEDHSVVAQLLRARAITPQEAQRHPYRNVITRCLGMQMEIEADTRHVRWQKGDRILLCTDGLSGLVSDEEMAEIAGLAEDPQAACDQLVNLALDRGGYDNVTVVLLANE